MIYGADLELEAGTEYSERFLLQTDISTRTALYFGIKHSKSDPDTAALVLIEETAGLLYIGGAAAATPANGDITVNVPGTGDITVTLSDEETVKLVETSGKAYYQIKWLDAGGEGQNLRSGRALIVSGIVREVG